MSKKIIFSKIVDVSDEYRPRPASQFLPEWYKKTQSYLNNKKDIDYNLNITATIKKCIPVFDALTSGYIIPTPCDLMIKKNENGEQVYLSSQEPIQFHSIEQAPYHPFMNNQSYPKWTNPWGIKTPNGYSCLFIAPVHGGNKYFTIAEGIVDTDTYNAPVNFPFVINDTDFEGLIPAGTPMAQVIPFKRESWSAEYSFDSSQSDYSTKLLTSKFFNRYKNLFWQKKDYK